MFRRQSWPGETAVRVGAFFCTRERVYQRWGLATRLQEPGPSSCQVIVSVVRPGETAVRVGAFLGVNHSSKVGPGETAARAGAQRGVFDVHDSTKEPVDSILLKLTWRCQQSLSCISRRYSNGGRPLHGHRCMT